jgi:hypothetical protein
MLPLVLGPLPTLARTRWYSAEWVPVAIEQRIEKRLLITHRLDGEWGRLVTADDEGRSLGGIRH